MNLSGIANAVGNGLGPGFGNFPDLAQFIVLRVWTILVPLAIFLLVRFGFTLITSNDESKVSGAKRVIASTLVGLMLAFISQRIFQGVYVSGGSWNPASGASILATEVRGILFWATTLVAPLGVLMLVIAGVKVLGTFGKEDMGPVLRNNIVAIAAGILLILMQPIISATLGVDPRVEAAPLGQPSPFPIIMAVGSVLSAILLFLALIAVAIIIYAGFMMIISVGSEEQYSKSKSLIVRALIGLVIIVLSYTLLQFVTSLFVGA